ncbi:MAG TPA: O-antigen ligase family protein [Patescibacteria group bacterium]|nr:O-antigen ligase family protein [Patescibacteria group bacterium]
MSAFVRDNSLLHFTEKLGTMPNFSWKNTTIFVLLQALIILLFLKIEAVLVVAGACIIAGVIQIFARHPRIWIYTVVAVSFFYLNFESEGIDAAEVVTGIFYLGGILIWMFWQTLIRRKKIIQNPGDWLVIFFLLVSITNLVVATLNSVSVLDWLREWTLLLIILYYFPIREYFTLPKTINKLLLSNALLIIALSFYSVYQYYARISKGIVYAFEYRSGGLGINETMFMAGIVFGVFAFTLSKKKSTRIIAGIFTAIALMALIITFRRTYWLFTLVVIVGAIPFIKLAYQKRLIMYSLVALLLVSASAYSVIGARGSQLLFSIVAMRFESSAKGTKDISLYARIVESNEALQHVSELPLSGCGMKSPIAFYEPILKYTKHNNFIHYGYTGSLHKLGWPLTILFFLPFFYFLWQGFKNVLQVRKMEPLMAIIALGSFCTLLGVLLSNAIISQFDMPMGTIVTAYCFAYIQIVKKNQKSIPQVLLN